MKKSKKAYIAILVVATIMGNLLTSCSDEFLDRQPLAQLSNATFWATEDDAMRALTSIYWVWPEYWSRGEFFQYHGMLHLDFIAGLGGDKGRSAENFAGGGLNASHSWIRHYWETAYERIALSNIFLANAVNIQMNESKKAAMLAEARFWRAYSHFYLALHYGNVPLVTKPLTIPEANSIIQSSQNDVINFSESELKDILNALPASRPAAELGRVTRTAALAMLGRVQMYKKSWADAANTYKSIIDLNVHSIDPRFKELFWEAGETSNEHILSIQYARDIYPNQFQKLLRPSMFGGYHQYNVYNNLVEAYLCTDGLPITESPLYDPNNPYTNRDPRLDYTVMIPGRTVFAGQVYVADPNSTSLDKVTLASWTGYMPYKYVDESYYPGNRDNWGGNTTLIRYAEVLLGYLESKLESGASIDQALLDNTINKLRGRAAVNMPFVTETNPAKLREIVRRERMTELAFEGIHLYDLLRWEIAPQTISRKYYGMKLTNDPANYTQLPVNDQGYLYYSERNFKAHNVLWPIPQAEMDINKNLVQNQGY